jgi:protein phosphatase 2C family protein 2/3
LKKITEQQEGNVTEVTELFDISNAVLPNHSATKLSTKRNGKIRSYGANTNQGISRNYNEDRVSIILNIVKPKEKH